MAELDTDPNQLLSKPWRKFLDKLNEFDSLKISSWKEVHILGYVCKRYQQLYNHKFALSFKGQPSRCPEIYLIKKVMAMLTTTDQRIVKEYIDWVFDQKIIPQDRHIRSLGYLTTPNLGNEFLSYRQKKNKICKSTPLPSEFKQVADTLQIPIITYGDLAFAKMALDQSPTSESRAPYRSLFNTLQILGFETSILNNLV